MSYLSKRGATYYFRRVIPDDLQPVIGRREFMVSLRTKDKEEAKRLIPHHVIASDQRLQEAREALAAASVPKPKAFVPSREEVEQEEAQAAHDEQAEMEQEALEPVMDAIEAGTVPDAPAVDLVRAGQLLALHERQMADIRLEERMARYAPKPEAVEKLTDAGVVPVLLAPDIFDLWKAEGSKRAKTVAMVEKSAEWFHARIGKVSVQDITKAHVIDFKNKLIAEGQTVANINVRLSHISLLLGWAARNAIVPDNVAKGTAIPNPQAKRNRRKPFDLAALKAIFASPVYADGERPAGGKGEAAYWLPVLALYTGARIRELAQLRRGDVREMEYADAEGEMHKGWFLSITEDTDADGLANAIKNDGSERLVPVHPKLIELGFVAYVQGIAKGRVFPELPEDIYGNPAAKWGEWFSDYLRKVCKVTDKRMVFHSFRHAFKDHARNALIPEGVQRQIMGHEGGDVADQYGSGYATHVVVAAMATYRVPGLVIPPPQ